MDYIMSLQKSNLSKTHMEQLLEPNFFKKFKVIASTAHTLPIFQILKKKKDFSENPKNLDMGTYL